MAAFQIKTFQDIYTAVREELGIQAGDTVAVNKIKRMINRVYLNEVVPAEEWYWLRASIDVTKDAKTNVGTASVSQNSKTVTLSSAPGISFKNYWFSVNGNNSRYKIAQHDASSSTLYLESDYVDATSTTAGYTIWNDTLALPQDCREIIEITRDGFNESLTGYGLQKLRQMITRAPKAEGSPRMFTTGTYVDPTPYESISGIPSSASRSASGLVRTLVFASSVADFLSVGDDIEISNAGDDTYNGRFIVTSVSGTTITYTSSENAQEASSADTGITIKLRDPNKSDEQYLELIVHPSVHDRKTVLHVDYIREAVALEDDTDEPLMPLRDRDVLVTGALKHAWRALGQNPNEATINAQLYQAKLSSMRGKLDDVTDHAVLRPSRDYLHGKRFSTRLRNRATADGQGFGGGGGGSQAVKGEAGKVAVFDASGDLSSSTFDSDDVLFAETAATLTNKIINANNNTISNLEHGAEVDNPSSGVHGVTGSVVGTTDTQTLTNKTLTSPVLNTSVSGTAILDEDNMASDSATQLATQQSIKAYTDNEIAAHASETNVVHGIASTSAIVGINENQTLTNKTLTSPVLNTSVSGTAVLDEDDMSSDSATQLATQQSIKAYVDSSVAPTVSRVQVDSGNGYGSTNTKIRRWTNTVENVGSDITYADSSTLGGSFTINSDGIYSITRLDGTSASSGRWGLSVNSNQLTTNIESITASNYLGHTDIDGNDFVTLTVVRRFSNGDVIRGHDASALNATSRGASIMIVERIL